LVSSPETVPDSRAASETLTKNGLPLQPAVARIGAEHRLDDMADYLITGGAGFIGSHLARALLARGDSVRVLDDLSTGSQANLPADAELIIGDIRDNAAVGRAMKGMAGCFHLAAIASVQAYRDNWATAAAVNHTGTLNVFESAARAGAAVAYASSAAIYGDNSNLPLSEVEQPAPISGYGADKLGNELHAAAMQALVGLNAVGLRFFNVFGERQAPGSPYSGVISIFARKILDGHPLTVFGDGQQARDFIYAADVAQALLAAMDHAGRGHTEVFNICTGRSVSLRDLIVALEGATGQRSDVRFEAPRVGDIRLSQGDPMRAAERLGFRATTPFADGIARTLDWMRAVD
jgi:UDP-glucose 4-epimerase